MVIHHSRDMPLTLVILMLKFKSHQQKPVGLVAGTRSLSEDSVFSPEPREAPIGSFPKSAVSEESLPKSAFQSELLSKLNKRRSQYSDDDRDDGLPRSPVPPVTTADVIMGAPLKPPGKKSSNRDSDQSLISVDSSENEEDKLFETNWKSAVPSIRSSKQDKHSSNSDMDPLDFSSIQKTELLTSGAAKDRISIKPKARRATSKSRKKRDTNSPLTLPSLNEESPSGVTDTGSNSPASPPGTKYTKTTPKRDSSPSGEAPAIKSPAKAVSASVSAAQASTATSTLSDTTLKSNSTDEHTSGTTKDTKQTTGSRKGVSATAGSWNEGKTNIAISERSAVQSSGKVSPTANTEDSPCGTDSGANNTSRLAARFLQTDKGNDKNDTSQDSPMKPVTSTDEAYGGVSLKSRMSQFQTGSNKDQKDKQAFGRGSGLKTSDPTAQLSPKSEDFRQKRQNRSKTLPGGTDSQEGGENSAQNSPGLQRAKSHRITVSSTQVDTGMAGSSSSKPASNADSQDKKPTSQTVATTTAAAAATTSVSPSSSVNKLGNRFAAFENNSSSSSEPAWMNLVKKKKEESEGNSSSSSVSSRTGHTSSAPKSVFSSSSYLEKKRGSVDSSSSGGNSSSRTNTPRDTSKVSETSSSSSSASTNLTHGKRESIEISVTELSSLKASANKATISSSSPSSSTTSSVFSSSSTSTSQSAAAASTSDRARLFSGVSQTSSSSSSKSVASSQQEPASTAVPDTPSRSAGGTINQNRGGSVKTSPTKSLAGSDSLKPWQSGRSSSVKVSPAFLAASSPASTSGNVSKPSGVVLSGKSSNASSNSSKPPVSPSTTLSAPSTISSSSSSSSGHSAQPMSNNNNKNTSSNNTSLPSAHSVLVTTTSTTPSVTPTASSSPTRSSSVKSAQTFALTSKPPPTASAFGVKSSGVKSVSFSGVKPDNSSSSSSSVQSTTSTTLTSSSSPRSNTGASVISIHSSSSTSSSQSSSTVSLSSSQSNLSKTAFGPATGRTNPLRAHASFTHPSSIKPVISASSTSSINKSPSMRTTHTPSPSSSVANKFSTSALKRASIDEQKKEEVKHAATVPAWRANLAAKKDNDVKIEIIESASKGQSSTPASSCSQQNKTEVVMRKAGEKSAFSEAAKKSEPATSQATSDKLNNRSSRVLDMVKNFQNLQVSS
ncbi:hypothetical protein ElyMa_001245300 [Elysia marginata]|uniref:Uncharacterized protein n=1 Tax=Elysia marginata TaxID=1093978 RepID=A0AAV4IA93_9GAST|nr:hypothetical protein ElyMa_001245300 [Elysia marginata]